MVLWTEFLALSEINIWFTVIATIIALCVWVLPALLLSPMSAVRSTFCGILLILAISTFFSTVLADDSTLRQAVGAFGFVASGGIVVYLAFFIVSVSFSILCALAALALIIGFGLFLFFSLGTCLEKLNSTPSSAGRKSGVHV